MSRLGDNFGTNKLFQTHDVQPKNIKIITCISFRHENRIPGAVMFSLRSNPENTTRSAVVRKMFGVVIFSLPLKI